MPVSVELFGIVRQRAGVAQMDFEAATLADVYQQLGARFPELATLCLKAGNLAPGFVANVNGERFVTAPETELQNGDAVLILSADAGG